MKLTQKQLKFHTSPRVASAIFHRAEFLGCKMTLNSNGRKVLNLCEFIEKSKCENARIVAEKLKIKPEFR